MADQSGQIQSNGLAPQEASSDSGSMRQHSISDQIAADRYAAAVPAAKSKNRGLRFSKLIPSGPFSDQQGTVSGTDNFAGA
jgi:hypothetical protein